MSKDPDYIVKVEQAIAKKYGEEAIQNPKAEWDENKEKVYLEQMRELYKKKKDGECLLAFCP
jgi:phosphoribosyl-ATP pyrophosphohydrolase